MTKTRLLAFALVPMVTVNIYAGCKFMGVNKTNDSLKVEPKRVSLEEVSTDLIIAEESVVQNDEILSTEIIYNSQEVLDGLRRIYNEKDNGYIPSVELDIASDLYIRLSEAGISDKTILIELENMMILGNSFTDFNPLSWHYLFGNLNSTISPYENVYDVYYPLARVVHTYSCELNHTVSEFDRVNCDILEEMFWDSMSDIPFKKYLNDKVLETGNHVIIDAYHRLINSGISFDILIEELNNLYTYATIPTELDEDTWNIRAEGTAYHPEPPLQVTSKADIERHIETIIDDMKQEVSDERTNSDE